MTGLLEKQERTQLQVHFIEGKKFKTNILGVLLRTALTRKNATKTALLAEVLKNGCQTYPSRQAVSIKIDEMEGGVFDISIIKKGDEQILFFYLEVLKYKEEFLEEGFTFLRNYLTQPLILEKAFPAEVVEREKKNLLIKIRARKDDKREYAKQRCIEELCHGEAFGIYADGYEEDFNEIDGETLYLYYYNILKHAPVEVLFCGDEEQKKTAFHLAEKLGFSGELVWDFSTENKKRDIGNPIKVKETAEINQGRLCIGYTSDITPNGNLFPALMTASEILGGGASSLLFENIREKQGLCYYVNSMVITMKSLLLIQTGIAPNDYEKTTAMIENVIQELMEKEVDSSKLENAKESLIRYFAAMEDTPTAQMDFKINQYLLNSSMELNDFIKKLEKVSAGEVCKAFKSLHLGAVYFLQSEEGQDNGNAERE